MTEISSKSTKLESNTYSGLAMRKVRAHFYSQLITTTFSTDSVDRTKTKRRKGIHIYKRGVRVHVQQGRLHGQWRGVIGAVTNLIILVYSELNAFACPMFLLLFNTAFRSKMINIAHASRRDLRIKRRA